MRPASNRISGAAATSPASAATVFGFALVIGPVALFMSGVPGSPVVDALAGVAGTLSRIPGVAVATSGPFGNAANLRIRGAEEIRRWREAVNVRVAAGPCDDGPAGPRRPALRLPRS